MSRQLTPTEHSYVYVIGHDTGPQKIGFSYHPPSRARSLKKAGQAHLKAHWWVKGRQEEVREIERLAHWILRDKALGREMFDITPREGIEAIESAANCYSNGERAPRKLASNLPKVPITLTPELDAMLEDWRASQRPVPNRSEAIRRLIAIGLDDTSNPKKPD